jgi:hypothetical protein
MARRATLSSFAAEKPHVVARAKPDPTESTKARGQTLRLNPDAWRQLKTLALERAVPSHVLLIEALNDLFRKHGKPPIA